jgi:hypothetical protein
VTCQKPRRPQLMRIPAAQPITILACAHGLPCSR